MKALFILSLLLAATMISAEDINFLSDDEDFDFDDSNGLDSFLKGAGGIIDMAKQVIEIFKSGKTSTLKERIEGKGFSYFKGACTVQYTKGLFVHRFDNFIDKLLDRIGVQDKYRKDVKGQMKDVLDVEDGVAFKTYNILFNAGSPNTDNTNSLTFVGAYNAKGNLDIFQSNMSADFKLAPDVEIITETKSLIGGLYTSSIDKSISKPRNVSPEEIKTIIAFFEYVGIEQFANFMGIKIPSLR